MDSEIRNPTRILAGFLTWAQVFEPRWCTRSAWDKGQGSSNLLTGGVIPSLEVNGQQLVQEIDMAIEEPKTAYFRVQHDKQEMPITHTQSTLKAMKIKLIKPWVASTGRQVHVSIVCWGPGLPALESLIRYLVRIPATSRMWSGWNYVRAWTSIQGSSHLGISGRRPIGLEDAFSLGWAWSGTCYHESSPIECTCHHCRTFWNIILRETFSNTEPGFPAEAAKSTKRTWSSQLHVTLSSVQLPIYNGWILKFKVAIATWKGQLTDHIQTGPRKIPMLLLHLSVGT